MHRTRHIACLLIGGALALPLAACGGGDDDGAAKSQLSNEGDAKGAETTVREYLRALVQKDGAKACGRLTPDYQRSIVEKNEEFARKHDSGTCAELIDAITKTAGPATFEGQALNTATVDKIPLKVRVRTGGEEQNATVTGAQGLQRYELVTSKGKWLIAEVTNAGG